jgi:hypothetical protein
VAWCQVPKNPLKNWPPHLRTIKDKRPFAHIWPPNGQTAKNRAKLSPPSRPPLNLSPEKIPMALNGFSRRTRLSHEIMPAGNANANNAAGGGGGGRGEGLGGIKSLPAPLTPLAANPCVNECLPKPKAKV